MTPRPPSVRVTIVLFAALAVAAGVEPSYPEPQRTSRLTCGKILWRADHESRDLSQWSLDDGGGIFNSGIAESSASREFARTGRWSVKATIDTSSVAETPGVRLFRWNEGRDHSEACYSAWYYFPRQYQAAEWWNIFSFKSRNEELANDAFWQLQVGNRQHGAMYVYLTWWGPPVEGPRPLESGLRHFGQPLKDIVPGRWTRLTVYLRQSSAFDGQIIVWQDGVELFNEDNVRTRYAAANGANEWSLNNYSDMVTPHPTTIYFDDAVINAVSKASPGRRDPQARGGRARP